MSTLTPCSPIDLVGKCAGAHAQEFGGLRAAAAYFESGYQESTFPLLDSLWCAEHGARLAHFAQVALASRYGRNFLDERRRGPHASLGDLTLLRAKALQPGANQFVLHREETPPRKASDLEATRKLLKIAETAR